MEYRKNAFWSDTTTTKLLIKNNTQTLKACTVLLQFLASFLKQERNKTERKRKICKSMFLPSTILFSFENYH